MASPFRIATYVFFAVAAMLLLIHANRVVATNDEGILLDAAQRVALGQRPYVDFWAYMSPGSYWLQGLVFKVFGVSMLTGRLLVIVDFSLQCALVFWLATRLASLQASVVVTLAFLGFQMADPSFLTAQHRWDSSTLALLGVALALSAHSKPAWAGVGAVLAVAAWCTPTVGMVLIVVALWLGFQRARLQSLWPLLAGAVGPFAMGAAWLAWQGGLIPLIEQMLWLRQNYLVNAMPYGSIIGGYGALFEDAHGVLDFGIRGVLVACVALPAILPPLALLGWGWLLWRGRVDSQQRAPVVLMLVAGTALILALSPRPDVMHLAFVVALPYVLVAALIPARVRVPTGLAAVLMACLFSLNAFTTLGATSKLPSPVGTLRVENKQRDSMQRLLATVQPGQPLFVYPYMPMHYFLTQAHNPTNYSFFSPGMATQREALAALAELRQAPPEWILYMKVDRNEYLRVVPKGDSVQWRYAELEDWLEQNYGPSGENKIVVSGYELRRRSTSVLNASRLH